MLGQTAFSQKGAAMAPDPMPFLQFDTDTPPTRKWNLCATLHLGGFGTSREKSLCSWKSWGINRDRASAWFSWEAHSWNPGPILCRGLTSHTEVTCHVLAHSPFCVPSPQPLADSQQQAPNPSSLWGLQGSQPSEAESSPNFKSSQQMLQIPWSWAKSFPNIR